MKLLLTPENGLRKTKINIIIHKKNAPTLFVGAFFYRLKEEAIPVTMLAEAKATKPEAIATCPAKN